VKIAIPELSLVLLVGASGSGKSFFGRMHFLATEVISSDFCRGLVADNENDVQPEARKTLIELAREYHVFGVAIVFDLPERLARIGMPPGQAASLDPM
jgi:protein phosphatase